MAKTYTTRDIAELWGCTIQAVCKARRKAEELHGIRLGEADPSDKRLTRFSETELETIHEFRPKIVKQTVLDAEMVSDQVETVTLARRDKADGLLGLEVANRSPVLSQDLTDLQEDRGMANALENYAKQQNNDFLNRFATYRAAQALAEIDTFYAQGVAAAINTATGSLGNAAKGQSS